MFALFVLFEGSNKTNTSNNTPSRYYSASLHEKSCFVPRNDASINLLGVVHPSNPYTLNLHNHPYISAVYLYVFSVLWVYLPPRHYVPLLLSKAEGSLKVSYSQPGSTVEEELGYRQRHHGVRLHDATLFFGSFLFRAKKEMNNTTRVMVRQPRRSAPHHDDLDLVSSQ